MEHFEIETISKSIKNAIDNSQSHYEYIESVQHQMEKALNEYLDSKSFDALYKEVSKYDKSLAKQIEDLMEQRNTIVEGMTLTQNVIFKEKNLNRNYFTIMLFGRTMAGTNGARILNGGNFILIATLVHFAELQSRIQSFRRIYGRHLHVY